MIESRIEADLGTGDSFQILRSPRHDEDTHPIVFILAHLNENRSRAQARLRIRFSEEQARVLTGMLQHVLPNGEVFSVDEEACIKSLAYRAVEDHKISMEKVREIIAEKIAEAIETA